MERKNTQVRVRVPVIHMAKVKSLASKKAHIQAPMMNSAKGVSPQSTPESQEGPQNIAHKPRAAAPIEIVANKDVPSRSIILRYMVVPRYLISRNATRVRIKQGLLRHHDPGPLWAVNTPPHRWGNLARHANVIRFSRVFACLMRWRRTGRMPTALSGVSSAARPAPSGAGAVGGSGTDQIGTG